MADAFSRKLLILQMLPREEEGGITVEEIQRRLWNDHGIEVSERNIQRDLRSLQGAEDHAGFPISCDEDKPKPWRWSWYGRELLGIPKMGRHTALTFQMVKDLLEPLLPAETMSYMQPNFDAAEEVLRKASAKRAGRWRDKIRGVPRSLRLIPPELEPGVLETVSQALLDDKQIEMSYRSGSRHASDVKSYPVHPYALIHRTTSVELIGRIDGDSKIRRWALHRTESAQLLDAPSSVPRSFKLDDFIQSELGFPGSGEKIKLEIWIHESAKNHVLETKLSNDQQIIEAADGLIVKATVNEIVELKWWLLGLGDRARVIRPESLRDAIKGVINKMVEVYQ
ncbi:MAG: hypothetical protein CMK32_01100 [Porticoccaceae bacterium]|nr:hypothetical protein [Porticoccaceae bacterium]